jgi:hypothetical protein
MTGELVPLEISALGDETTRWFDALHQVVPDIDNERLRLRPYQSVWLMPTA